MKTKLAILCLLTTVPCLQSHAQGTAFTYQGRLNDGSGAASGIYDLRFTIYGVSSGGSVISGPLTNAATAVSNGLFAVTLDFGTGIFTGADRWLEIGVRTNGGGAFTALTPRQQITPTPYAIYAKGAAASGITGTLPSSAVFGNYNNAVSFNNGANSFSGSFYGQFFGTSFTGGSFSGDGSGLLNLNASQISEGNFPASSLNNAWRTIGNSNTSPATHFIGTTDNQPLQIRVNDKPGLRIEPDPRGNDAANIVGGYISNRIEQPNSGGSTIVGGGYVGGINIIRSNSSGVFIGGGSANQVGPNVNDAVIAGGFGNTVQTYGGFIGGGNYNWVQTNADSSMIGGGYFNTISPGSGFSAIPGGYFNTIHTNSGFSVIAGGFNNEIQGLAGYSAIGGGVANHIRFTADQSVIAGGYANEIFPGAPKSFIGGGFANLIHSNAANGVIGGGSYNIITNATQATIGGGVGNTNNGYAATVAGGFYNTAANNGAAVGGGGLNVAAGFNATVGGGDFNQALNANAVVSGGYHNTNTGTAATIGGGYENQTPGPYATVPGGLQNSAAGLFSFAAGQRAKANHQGSFVWADSTAADFFSAANNEFAVRASGGVRFVVSGFTLNGQPVLTANANNAVTLTNVANNFAGTFNGDGSGLTNLSAWRLDGNTLSPGQFLGSVNNEAVEIRVNNQRAMRLEPTATSPNIVGGHPGNSVGAGGSGAVIAGGGSSGSPNTIGVNSARSTIGGGEGNQIDNAVDRAVIAGGANNRIIFNGPWAVISGGRNNVVGPSGDQSVIAGGAENSAQAIWSVIGGGLQNTNATTADKSTIGGGSINFIGGGANEATIAGGRQNSILNDADYSMVPGGFSNTVTARYAFAAGRQAKANHQGAFVWADSQNADFASTANDQFAVRANNGVVIQSATNGTALELRTGGAIKITGAGVGTGTPAFIHRAVASNITAHITTIDHPLCNNDPNAILIVTHNWNPGNGIGIYNTNVVGVYYTGSRWTIFNQVTSAPMITNSAFNVLVIKP